MMDCSPHCKDRAIGIVLGMSAAEASLVAPRIRSWRSDFLLMMQRRYNICSAAQLQGQSQLRALLNIKSVSTSAHHSIQYGTMKGTSAKVVRKLRSFHEADDKNLLRLCPLNTIHVEG